jgi:hypothetical protein
MKSNKTVRWSRIGSVLIGFIASAIGMNIAQAQDRMATRQAQGLPAGVQALKLDAPLHADFGPSLSRKLGPGLAGASGRIDVVVQLTTPAAASRSDAGPAAILSSKANILGEQDGFLQRWGATAPDMKVIARMQIVLNAVIVDVDAALLPDLARDASVSRIAPVVDYELDLSETVPYIGAEALQMKGIDGEGIRLAVLDSGIDYTHKNLGGAGTLAAYADAYADPASRDGLFPTAKVVDGYDFVGEEWPFGPLTNDDDPIDFEGHGTHVADISGGLGGVAPGVDLYGVKVCSAVSSSCSGTAILQGLEWAADPDGDGYTEDRVDIINMSLGALYGQPFDIASVLAVDNLSKLGILTVASAGNSGDRPYVTGTPAAARTALSVAQTQVPSAFSQLIGVDDELYSAVFQPWSTAPAGVISGPVQYGDGAGGALDGCSTGGDPNAPSGASPFPPGSLDGKIVIVDRGGCFFSTKIQNIEAGGGLVGIIAQNSADPPFPGGFGAGDPPGIPGYMISRADGNAIKAQIGGPGIGTVDPAVVTLLNGQMVSSSSRGPSNYYNAIKPEIGAPGASVSAEVGTGDGETAFGGTSGAAPMVAGSAALVIEAFCKRLRKLGIRGGGHGKGGYHQRCELPPSWIKTALINTADEDILIDSFSGPAEITRIGGGEVRVDRAAKTAAVAMDEYGQAALSFGFHDVKGETHLEKRVYFAGQGGHKHGPRCRHGKGRRDYKKVTWTIEPTFRFADDEDTGAVEIKTYPSKITLYGHDIRQVKVKMRIDGSKLPGNYMNSGGMGNSGPALSINEYDGYLKFTSNYGDEIHMPWQVLPRKAAHVKAESKTFPGGGFPDSVALHNKGVGTAQIDGFALVATSPDKPRGGEGENAPMPDLRAFGVNTFESAGCAASFIWAFAFNTHERQTHLVPVINQVELDIDQDGTYDYAVFNFDLSFSGSVSDGRQVAWAQNLSTGGASAFFFAEHATNTGNTVLYVCGEQVGLTSDDILSRNVDARVTAIDWYFGGGNDVIEDLTIAPLGEQYFPVTDDIDGNSADAVRIYDFGAFPGNTPECGVLLNTNGDRGTGARGGATERTEATLILAEEQKKNCKIPKPEKKH